MPDKSGGISDERIAVGDFAQSVQRSGEGLGFIDSLNNVRVYAKTGTLSIKGSEDNWKRLVLALVRWKDERQGVVQSGLVFSIVVERDALKRTSYWLGEFLKDNGDLIKQLLDEDPAAQH